MEHYEVTNLFRINWTMKEKLVEKIYEPLASILEKHAQQLREFTCPRSYEIEEILAKTYYKIQMPFELLEQIDYYTDQIKDLDRKEHYARIAMAEIVNRNILECLNKDSSGLSNELKIGLKALSKTGSQVELYPQVIFQLLLTNQNIQTYLKKNYWRDVFEKISITYFTETCNEHLNKFDELVWSKCLKEASENAKILQMKGNVETLSEEAWDLIEQITGQ
jgi:hypothetical protein